MDAPVESDIPHSRATVHAQKAFHSLRVQDGSAQGAILAKVYGA